MSGVGELSNKAYVHSVLIANGVGSGVPMINN